MRKIIIAAIALSAATPALANDQLARSLGLEPGQYTAAELAVIKAHSTQEGNDARFRLDNTRFAPSRSDLTPTALAQFERALEESNGAGVAD